MMLAFYMIVFGVLLPVNSNIRTQLSVTPALTNNQERNETENFYSEVMSGHTRYCLSGSTCKSTRYDICYQCYKCQCDSECGDYGDCCPDVALRKPKQITKDVECISSLVEHVYPSDTFWSKAIKAKKYYMVATCPSDDPTLLRLCLDSTAAEPVTAMDEVTTYKNKHCALCHNVTSTISWKLSIECSIRYFNQQFQTLSQLVNTTTRSPNCSVKFQPPPGVKARECFNIKGTITKCNVTGLWTQYDEFLEKACLSYSTIKEVDGKLYNNPFCFICNTNQPATIFTICKTSYGTPSFTALLDFSDILYDDDEVRRSKCPKANVYDPDKKQCRQLTCSRGRELRNESCVSILGKSKGSAYQINLELNSEKEIQLLGENGILDDLQANLESYFLHAVLESRVTFPSIGFAFNTTSEYGNCSHYASQIFFSAKMITVHAIDHDLFEQKLLSWRNVSFTLWYDSGEIDFTTSAVSNSDSVLQSSTRNQKGLSSSCTIVVSSTPSNTSEMSAIEYVPVDSLLMCPRIILEKDEFRIESNDTLRLEWNEQLLSADEYQKRDDGRVQICLNKFKPTGKDILDGSLSRSASAAEVMVSIVCTALSLTCLLISFIVYCTFKSLRSMPGKNNMNLVVSLFFAQLLYLVGAGRTENKGVCKAAGIFIHYFWLSAFCAMSVCSFHMFRVFTTMRNRDDSTDRRRRFLQYSVYIYGFPAILVAVTLVAHIISTNGTTIGYGGDMCYLSSALAIALAFGIPVAVTVVSNSLFFIITLRAIRRQPKVEKSKQDEHHSIVYVKLSTLTGITWTIGFVAIITRVEALSYIFILTNASQGLFLFVSFVCNARVKKLILSGKESSSSAASRNDTRKTSTTIASISSVAVKNIKGNKT